MSYPQPTNPYGESSPPYPPAYTPPYSVPMPPPSGPEYAPPPPPPIPRAIVQPTSVFLGHNPQPMQCPICGQQIVTRVIYTAGGITWLMALAICFFGGICGCFLIPFCMPGCQDATHTCPSCQTVLGRRSPF